MKSGLPLQGRKSRIGIFLAALAAIATTLFAQSTPAADFQKNREAARRYLSAEQFSLALPFLEKARALNASDYDNDYDLAKSYLQTGQLEKARAEATHLLSIKDTADGHTLSGNIETAAHFARTAAEQYQIAAHMDPSEDRIFDFGSSLLSFESDAATRIFSYGVGKYPQSSLLYIGLGEAYDVQEKPSEAVAALCHAMDINPDDARPIDFLGKLPAVSPEDVEKIDLRFTKFLASHPDNAEANFYLARDLLSPKNRVPSEDDVKKGERLLKTSIRLNPKLPEAHFELGRLCEKRKQTTEAISEYETAVTLDPTEERYHYRLSIVYRLSGDGDKADNEFEIFRRLRAEKDAKYGPKDVLRQPPAAP